TAVLKLYTAAWLPHLSEVLAAVDESLVPERVVFRASRAIGAACAQRAGLRDGDLLAGAAPRRAGAVPRDRARAALRPGARAEDGLVHRSAREPRARRGARGRPQRARRLRLHGRLLAARGARRGGARAVTGREPDRARRVTRELRPEPGG